ncbi:SpoIIE family protein phosphatase [Burkholderia plantarii]|uniref:SpoIIE family protein phosphatase n=1 Tax=Burkholderia plantarii TaxID=41899 RepID=UPI0018DCD89B|nr:SpoIIE family protein phosphatase [Burkholderia plantarii]MBI0330949.1 SpoIIE family protein phosphatase [Burkholderia plantarii]
MKRIEAIIGHHTAQLPAWLNSRSVLIGGAFVGALLIGAAGAFAWWEHRGAIDDERASATMLARAIDEESARAASTANSIARAIDSTLQTSDLRHADYANTLLARFVAGAPVVRSLSLVDSTGLVFASSNEANVGTRLELGQLPGPRMPSTDGDLAIGHLLAGRDLADSALARGTRPSAARALPLHFLPLARTAVTPDGDVIRIVIALNPDYLKTTFQMLLADAPRSAALVTLDGTPIAATGAPLAAIDAYASHPLFRTLLPHGSAGTFDALEFGGTASVGAWRTARRWPFVTIVATPEADALANWTVIVRWVAFGTGVVLVLWGVFCTAAARSLRQNALTIAALGQLMREIASSEARNTAVLTSAMDGMVTLDALGHVVEFNREAERIFGYRAENLIGQPGEALLPDEIHELMRTGRAPGDDDRLAAPRRRLELNARRANGRVFPAEISVAPVDVDGELYYFCTVRDLSEVKRAAHERAQLLAKYRDSSSDLRGLKSALDEHAIVSILAPDGTILYANTMLASVSGYQSDELVGQSYRMLRPDDASGGLVVDGLPGLIREGAPWSGQLVHRRRDGSLFWTASTLVPIMNTSHDTKHAFLIQTDISLQVAGERALKDAHRAELELGAGIQRGLLIGDLPPAVHDCLIASFNVASRGINGDFFDLFEFDDGCFDLLVGDAMGKGVPAALLGAALKMQFSRSIAELVAHGGAPGNTLRPSPARIVAHAQRAMHARLQALDSFVTLCYLRIDRVRGTATWVGCGHEETMLFRGNAPPEFLRNQHPPLGVIEEAEVFEDTVRLGSGDTLALYSDGLTDAVDRAGERFGLDRLASTLRALLPSHRRPGTIVRGMRAAVEAFTNSARIPDDMTMLVLQLPDVGPNARRARLDMPRTLSQLQLLRNFVTTHTAAGLGDDDAAALALAAVELASNIVRHDSRPGDGPIEVVGTTGTGFAMLEFVYDGRPFTPPPELAPDFSGESEGGFGLFIIRESCDEVSHDHANGINRVVLVKRRHLLAG